MGMDVGSKKGGVKSDINVTPLVDIVLVLLIIFIVITPAVDASVKLPTAKYAPKVDKPADPTTKYLNIVFQAKKDANGKYTGVGPITIDDKDVKGRLFMLGNAKDEQDLGDYVNRSVAALNGDRRVFVKADGDLPFVEVNKLFQLVRKNGADEASIVTNEEKDKPKEGGK
jgi:biopolymer transport protein TolR